MSPNSRTKDTVEPSLVVLPQYTMSAFHIGLVMYMYYDLCMEKGYAWLGFKCKEYL